MTSSPRSGPQESAQAAEQVRAAMLRGQQGGMRRPLPAPLRLMGGLAIMIVIGTLLFLLPGVSTGERLTVMEAAFTATSALSVTGLSTITPATDLTLFGQILLMLQIQLGGVGFMVAAVVAFWVLGRRISLPERLALSDSLGLIMPGAILKLTRQVMLAVLSLEAIGAFLLWLHWRDELGAQRAAFYAIFHAVSSFCNAGFDLFSGLPQYPQGVPNDNWTLLLLGGLIFFGGLGIPVMADLFSYPSKRRISLHTRLTLMVVLSLNLAGGLAIFLSEREVGRILAAEPWYRQLLMAFFQAISARTAGFAGIQPFEQLSPAAELVLTVLMFIGAAPASMGGGITTGTFVVLTLALWAYAQGLPTPQVGGRRISPDMVRKASAVLTIALLAVLLATWLILMTHPQVSLDVVVFEVVSAFATCGLTLAFTSQLNPFGQIVIMVMMFWGRLGALTIILALAQLRQKQLYEYPEEKILIG